MTSMIRRGVHSVLRIIEKIKYKKRKLTMKKGVILGVIALLVHFIVQGGIGLLLVAVLILAVLKPAIAE